MSNSSSSNSSVSSDNNAIEQWVSSLQLLLHKLQLFWAPSLFVLSLFGTVLVLCCLCRGWKLVKGKDLSLVALTVADCTTVTTGVLFNGFMKSGLGQLTDLRLPHVTSTVVCKLYAFCWMLSSSLSANLLLLLAADRVFALCSPLKHRHIMTKKRYCIVLFVFVLVLAAATGAAISTYEVYEYFGKWYCYKSTKLSQPVNLMTQLYTNLVVNGLVGSVILFCINVYLCFKIHSIRKERQKLQQAAMNEGGADWRAAATLVILASVFLVANLPRSVLYFFQFLVHWYYRSYHSGLTLLFQIAENLTYLFYTNCSINWMIYCLRVPVFRNNLPFIGSCKRRTSANYET